MTQKIVAIDDEAFRGQLHTNPTWNGPNPILWKREDIADDEDIVIYTDDRIWEGNKKGKVKIAWLFEGRSFKLVNYEYIERNHAQFDYVFTWDKKLLDLNEGLPFPKFINIPYGGSWINEVDEQMYPKTKNVSIVASGKRFLEGHHMRHEVIEKYPDKLDGIYGYGYNPIPYLLEAYQDYRFTVVIENMRSDWGFSEKIITPILCGTIPIYCGMPSISTVFDKGILHFDTVEQLGEILSSIDETVYNDMLPAALENFKIAQKYKLMELEVARHISEIEARHFK